MKRADEYKKIFDRYGGMMRTKDLQKEKIQYRTLQRLIDQEVVEKFAMVITNGLTRKISAKLER